MGCPWAISQIQSSSWAPPSRTDIVTSGYIKSNKVIKVGRWLFSGWFLLTILCNENGIWNETLWLIAEVCFWLGRWVFGRELDTRCLCFLGAATQSLAPNYVTSRRWQRLRPLYFGLKFWKEMMMCCSSLFSSVVSVVGHLKISETQTELTLASQVPPQIPGGLVFCNGIAFLLEALLSTLNCPFGVRYIYNDESNNFVLRLIRTCFPDFLANQTPTPSLITMLPYWRLVQP